MPQYLSCMVNVTVLTYYSYRSPVSYSKSSLTSLASFPVLSPVAFCHITPTRRGVFTSSKFFFVFYFAIVFEGAPSGFAATLAPGHGVAAVVVVAVAVAGVVVGASPAEPAQYSRLRVQVLQLLLQRIASSDCYAVRLHDLNLRSQWRAKTAPPPPAHALPLGSLRRGVRAVGCAGHRSGVDVGGALRGDASSAGGGGAEEAVLDCAHAVTAAPQLLQCRPDYQEKTINNKGLMSFYLEKLIIFSLQNIVL